MIPEEMSELRRMYRKSDTNLMERLALENSLAAIQGILMMLNRSISRAIMLGTLMALLFFALLAGMAVRLTWSSPTTPSISTAFKPEKPAAASGTSFSSFCLIAVGSTLQYPQLVFLAPEDWVSSQSEERTFATPNSSSSMSAMPWICGIKIEKQK